MYIRIFNDQDETLVAHAASITPLGSEGLLQKRGYINVEVPDGTKEIFIKIWRGMYFLRFSDFKSITYQDREGYD